MRRTVGLREFRSNVSEILRRVREAREAVDIAYHGEVIARIVPVLPRGESDEMLSAVWTDLGRLAGEIEARRGDRGRGPRS